MNTYEEERCKQDKWYAYHMYANVYLDEAWIRVLLYLM